ncbi:hypothetical protein OH76DRAFT_557112 [Lentinus brumalis]|uniref:Uncharacterized protein n=1 Tax=Lentinus brumalis TaxID=2498619 RepID=A0A371D9C6_9APHY|nr:hypothetical protein OH76DRAFT_557112 [Polyporus brumalis]
MRRSPSSWQMANKYPRIAGPSGCAQEAWLLRTARKHAESISNQPSCPQPSSRLQCIALALVFGLTLDLIRCSSLSGRHPCRY